MFAQRQNLILVVQHARALDDEKDFLLAVVEDLPAIAMPIQRDFSGETSYGLEGSVLFVPLAENSPVVASWRRENRLRLLKVWNPANAATWGLSAALALGARVPATKRTAGVFHVRCSRLALDFVSGRVFASLMNRIRFPGQMILALEVISVKRRLLTTLLADDPLRPASTLRACLRVEISFAISCRMGFYAH